jgi:hypothetical protein
VTILEKSTTTVGEPKIEVDEGISPVIKEADEFMRLNPSQKYLSR